MVVSMLHIIEQQEIGGEVFARRGGDDVGWLDAG